MFLVTIYLFRKENETLAVPTWPVIGNLKEEEDI